MKKITILLTKYSDWISCLLFYIGGRGYTHASLGLEENKNVFFSFNYKGFCVETAEKHRHRGVKKSLLYELEVPDSTYAEIRGRIAAFQKRRPEYRYTRIGVLCAVLQIPFHWKKHYICSQFVAELLKDTGAVPLRKRPDLYLPNQLGEELEKHSELLGKILNPI